MSNHSENDHFRRVSISRGVQRFGTIKAKDIFDLMLTVWALSRTDGGGISLVVSDPLKNRSWRMQ